MVFFHIMFGIDTCSWLKLNHLAQKGWHDLLSEILSMGNVFITQEVRKELDFHLHEPELALEQVFIFPTKNVHIQKYIADGFDPADASLLEYSEEEEHTIITEDGAVLAENVTDRNNIIQLVDFFIYLAGLEILTKRELYHLVRYLRKVKNITQKKEQRILNERLSLFK